MNELYLALFEAITGSGVEPLRFTQMFYIMGSERVGLEFGQKPLNTENAPLYILGAFFYQSIKNAKLWRETVPSLTLLGLERF